MTVRYIRVNPVADLFAPAVRAYGNLAIVGAATSGPANEARLFTNPADAVAVFPGDLGASIRLAFQQEPGPALVYGVRLAGTAATDLRDALQVVSGLDAQFVVLANTALDATTADATGDPPSGAIVQLANHVAEVSNTGGDGKERMGVAMLESEASDPSILSGTLAHERMVYIAHKSTQ